MLCAAEARWGGRVSSAPSIPVNRVGANIIPCSLVGLKYSGMGVFEINSDLGIQIKAQSVLVCLKADKSPHGREMDERPGGYVIRHNSVVDMASGSEYQTNISSFTTTNVQKMLEYCLDMNSASLCLVTSASADAGGNIIEIVIAEQWGMGKYGGVITSDLVESFVQKLQSTICTHVKGPLKRRQSSTQGVADSLFTPTPTNTRSSLSPSWSSPN